MSASEFEWVADNPELVKAPRADHRPNPAERVEAHCYKSGVIELRSAKDGEYLNSTHGIPCLEDHR